jgi:hypothetical protein
MPKTTAELPPGVKVKSQFSLPKSGRMLPPKKVNAVLDMQSDAAVSLPRSGAAKVMKLKGS